MYVIVYCTE